MEQSELELDKAIQAALTRDAERLPAFDSVPNARLASQLASQPSAMGVFSFFSMKLAILTVSIAAAGSIFYFVSRPGPQLTPSPIKPQTSVVNRLDPAPNPPSIKEAPEGKASIPVKPPAPPKLVAAPNPPLHLDEGDGKNIPTITDNHIKPAMK
ncbi:MAG TPA: hypothetical protein VG537_06815 [Candidatus Kapabacteria bacterium]|jgi:hypothetical protein|nr:hypothetical protein [Candidatus Kapabacteria bacterium]